VALGEALSPAFRAYAGRVVENARDLASGLAAHGYQLVSGGTDNHLLLLDLRNVGMGGRPAALAMER